MDYLQGLMATSGDENNNNPVYYHYYVYSYIIINFKNISDVVSDPDDHNNCTII